MGIRIYSNSFSNPEYYSYSYSLKVDLTNNIRIRIRVKISIRDNTDPSPQCLTFALIWTLDAVFREYFLADN